MFAARLVAYEPAGKRLAGALVDGVSWDASLPLNDVSALSLAYPDVVDPLGLSDAPVEIALQVSDGGDWVEPRNSRFLSSEVQADLAAELDVPKYSFRGLGALLERPFVLRAADNPGKPYTNDDDDPKRNFLSATAGQIITSILNESRAKYPTMLDGIELGFSASKDSLGATWNKLDSVAYSAGTDLLRILDDMTARGICDWWLQGRTLMVCNADKAAVKHDLRLNLLDVTESPLRATFENLASTVIVEGAQGKHWQQPVAGSQVPYGARVIRVANDSISTEATAMDLIARQALQATAPRREYTRTIATIDTAPGISFECGDWVWAKTSADWEQVRVHELGLSYAQDDAALTARVTLNDRFQDAAVRDAKRLKGITHGTTQNLGDGGIPSKSDKATPAAPKGVAANSLGYWQDAVPLSSVDVSWQAVTADTNGLALNGVDYYEVTVGGQSKRATSTSAGFDELQPSRIYPVQVRAVSTTGIRGKWSTVTEVLTAYPLPQLDPPTKPLLVTGLGSIQVDWDGMLQGAGAPYAPPRHFSHILVEMRREDTLTWTRWGRDHGFVMTGLAAGVKWYVRLVAVDMLGNESGPSPESSITVASTVQEALAEAERVASELAVERERVTEALNKALEAYGGIQGALDAVANLDSTLTPKINAAQAAANSAVTDLTSIFDDVLVKGAGGTIRLKDGTVTAPNIVASEALSAKFAQFLTVEASKIIGDNAVLNAAFVKQLVGGDAFFQNVLASRLAIAQQWWRVSKSSGNVTVSDSVVDASKTPQIRYENGRAYINDSGVTSGANRGISMVQGRALLTSESELGSTLLGPNSITTPMLTAQAVSAEKIKVGALDAFQITSPLIQSVSTANRGIKWNGANLIGYNSAGAETFRLDATRATITGGTIQTVAQAARGVKITASGLVAYDDSGAAMVRLEGNTGEITGMTITGGIVRTAATGRRVTLGTSAANTPAIYLFGSSGATHRATLQVNAKDVGILEFRDASGTSRLNLNSLGQLTAYSPAGTQALSIFASGTSVGTSTRVEFQGPSVADVFGLIYMGSESVDGTMTQTAVVTIGGSARGSEYSFLRVTNGGAWYLGSAGSKTRGYLQLANDTGALQIYSRTGLYWWYNLPATTRAGQPLTMIVSGSGAPTIYRQSSLRADKTDIQDIDIDPYAVLKLRPRTFFDAGEWKRYMDGLEARMQRQEGLDVPESRALWEGTSKPRRIPGLIAEEVIEVIPELGSWDDAGNLVGVQYERAPEYMLLAMIAMKKEIDELRARIGASND